MLLPNSRWSAFLIHIGFSFLIFLSLAAVIFIYWFPGALFWASGGVAGIKIVAAVDLVLGPLLTLIVYNKQKPVRELARDLGVIASIQVLCLVAGVYAVFYSRPLAVVHVFDTFYVLNAESYAARSLDPVALAELPGRYPKLVYVDVPRDKKDFLSAHVKSLLAGEPIQLQVADYKPMPAEAEQLNKLLGAPAPADAECLRVDIETPYKKGSICFDAGRFSRFVEQDW